MKYFTYIVIVTTHGPVDSNQHSIDFRCLFPFTWSARASNINDPHIKPLYKIQTSRQTARRVHTNKIDWQTLPLLVASAHSMLARSIWQPTPPFFAVCGVSTKSYASPLRYFLSYFQYLISGWRLYARARVYCWWRSACGSLAVNFDGKPFSRTYMDRYRANCVFLQMYITISYGGHVHSEANTNTRLHRERYDCLFIV